MVPPMKNNCIDDRKHALMISRDNFGTPDTKYNPKPDVRNTNMAAKPIFVIPNVWMVVVVPSVVVVAATTAMEFVETVAARATGGII